jgi:hypothetical protein
VARPADAGRKVAYAEPSGGCGERGVQEFGVAAVVSPLVVAVVALFLARAAWRREPDRFIAKAVALGLVAKLLGTVAYHFVVVGVYGSGDVAGYVRRGQAIGSMLRSGTIPSGVWEPGTPFMEFLAGVAFAVLGPSEFGGYLLFSLLGFAGMYLCLQAFRLAAPEGDHRRYAVLVLFFPALVFWPATIGKEAWLVFTLGLGAYGAARVLRRRPLGYILVAFGVVGMAAVRPHMSALFALSFAAAFLLRFRDPAVKRGIVAWTLGLVVVSAGVAYTLVNFSDEMGRSEVEYMSITDRVRADAEEVLDRTDYYTRTGAGEFESRPVENVSDVGHAIVTVPFRPFPWEAHNAMAQLSGIEGLALLILVLASAPRLVGLPRQVLRTPYVALAFTYALGFVIAFSHVGNFGILTRQRVQLLPFLLVLLCLPVAESLQQRTRGGRRKAALAGAAASAAPEGSKGGHRPVLIPAGASGEDPAAAPDRRHVPVLVPATSLAAPARASGEHGAGTHGAGPPSHDEDTVTMGARTPAGAARAAAPEDVHRDRGAPPSAARPPGGPRSGGRRPVGSPPGRSRPRGQRLVRVVLAVLLLGIPVGGGVIAYDMIMVRSSLTDARSSLQAVRGALGDIDILEARAALATADDELETARSRAHSIRWSVASVAPVVGHSVRATREVVESADAAVELSSIALAGGQRLIGTGLDIEVEDGRLDLDPLMQARDLVDQLPIDRLAAAHAELASPPEGWVPRQLLDGRSEVLELSDAMLETVVKARGLTTALPGFLGTDQPRRYFVGMQTPAELRGTGGLVGFWGVLSFEDGRATFGQSDVYDADTDGTTPDVERIGRLSGPYDVGVTADPEFHARYAHLLGTSSFSNVNLEPDLPSTARVWLDLFAMRTGERLDGMVLIDPAGLQGMLEATGDTLPLDPELAASLELEEAGLATGDFARFVTQDIYEVLGYGRDEERNDALREIGDAALGRVLDGRWDGVRMARALAAASTDRHLQVFSENGEEQTAFTDVGITGSLTAPDAVDQLAVTANNAVGGKQDVHLGHEFALDLHLDDVGRTSDGELVARRRGTLGVTVDNPLPTSGMDEYVIGNCFLVGETNECFEGPPGWNWTWFNTWLPPGTQVLDTRVAEHSLEPIGPVPYRGLRVLDQFHATPPESRSSFEVDVAGLAPLTRTADGMLYEWSWWRQSKAVPDLLDVRVHAPSGWSIERVEVAGGGDGRGSGVHAEGVELVASVEGATAHLTGTVTSHTRLQVHLAPAG